MDLYKSKMQSDGSIDKLNLRILRRGYLQKKDIIGDIWSTTAPTRTLKYFLVDDFKHKSRVNQLYFIGALLQAKTKHRVFVKVYRRYGDYFPEYCNYFGIPLIQKKSMYGMDNYGKYLIIISPIL